VPGDAPNRSPSAVKPTYRFGEFEVRSESGELFRNSTRVRVQEQSLQVLLTLLENSGAVVSRDQLRGRLWPDGTYVDFEHSLNAAVKRLRAALEDDAESPRYIETLPKRGYRFIYTGVSGESTSAPIPSAPLPTKPESDSRIEPRRRLGRFTLGFVLVLLTAVVTLAFWHWRSVRRAAANFASGVAAPPQNSEAYELYLRSLGYKYEFPSNAQAIDLLERSAALDSRSARSWYELARRYNVQFTNAARGHGFFEQARAANRRALELAPDFLPARAQEVILDVQGGQVIPAYHAALAMTREHPQDAYAHIALASALRYGGMFEESAAECDLALKLDPSNSMLPSCALVQVLLQQYDLASAYLDLDPLANLTHFRRMELAILRNDKTTALAEARLTRLDPHAYPDARLMEAALSGAPAETVQSWSREDEALNDRITLPQLHFVDARYQSWAGQTEAALRLLRRAIANNYCSYPVMDSDPFLANVRRLPEYQELREVGIACRENFRVHMHDH
jgi:DNA-binding winged helix-turn-helix (wHTH) protein